MKTTTLKDKIIFFGLPIMIMLFVIVLIFYKMFGSSPLFTLSEGVMIADSKKLSYKGFIWKTYDGWIPVGITKDGGIAKWYFTIKDGDKDVVECITNNTKVKLYYKDHLCVPYRLGYRHQVYKCEPIR